MWAKNILWEAVIVVAGPAALSSIFFEPESLVLKCFSLPKWFHQGNVQSSQFLLCSTESQSPGNQVQQLFVGTQAFLLNVDK